LNARKSPLSNRLPFQKSTGPGRGMGLDLTGSEQLFSAAEARRYQLVKQSINHS
jgi:hypothetical protein